MNEKDIGDILASSSDSESYCNESGHSEENLAQRRVAFASELEEWISCGDYISESCSSESEHSSKKFSLHEKSPCTSLSDEQMNSCSKCSTDVANHRTSENGICRPVMPTKSLCHESLTSTGPSRRATSRGLSRRATSRGLSRRATSRGLSRRATSRGLSCRATSRGPSRLATSRGQAVLHYTPVHAVVPYYEVASVPYYQSGFQPYYQAAYIPRYQEVSVPCAGLCYRSSSGPCCLTAERTISCQTTAIPIYQTVSVPSYPDGAFQRSRGISFSRPRACLSPESKINPRRGVVAFPRRRRGRYPLLRGYGAMTRNTITRTTFDHLDVAGSSQNQAHKKCLNLSDEDEQSLCNTQQHTRLIKNSNSDSSSNDSQEKNKKIVTLTNLSDCIGSNNYDQCLSAYKYSDPDLLSRFLSGVSRSSNEEKDFAAIERYINNISRVSDSNSCDKSKISNISDFSDIEIRNPKPAASKNGKISNSEFSDGKSSNDSNRHISMKDINHEELNIVIYTESDPKARENLPQPYRRFSSETSDISHEILPRCVDEKIGYLNESIRLEESEHIGIDATELDVSEFVNNSDSSQKELVESFPESRNIDERETFHESCEGQTIAVNTIDKYELKRILIRILQEFFIILKSKCKRVSAKSKMLLSKNTELASVEESRMHQISIYNICLKMQPLEGIIEHLRKWCDEYYDDIRDLPRKLSTFRSVRILGILDKTT